MRPGRAAITTTRVDRNTASTMLCVTKTTVSPRAAHSASSSASSRWRVNSSSAPKGSSISSRSGEVTSARAIDARICMPPESSRGNCPAASDNPTSASAASTSRSAPPRGTPARSSGSRTLVAIRAQGISAGAWKTIANRRPGTPVASNPSPHQRSVPAVGSTRPAISLSSVVLPQPEGPSSVTNSPRRTARSTGASACRPPEYALRTPATSITGAVASPIAAAVRAGPSRRARSTAYRPSHSRCRAWRAPPSAGSRSSASSGRRSSSAGRASRPRRPRRSRVPSSCGD